VFTTTHICTPAHARLRGAQTRCLSQRPDAGEGGQCGGSAGVHIAARWDGAIASYDPMARSMWLEFDIQDAASRQGIDHECLAVCVCVCVRARVYVCPLFSKSSIKRVFV
jgi:hypothetical protein